MRRLFNQRHETFSQTLPWQLSPVARRFVVAGETIGVKGRVVLETGNQAELKLPGLTTVYAFFVPARLVHADWSAQLAGDGIPLAYATIPAFVRIFDNPNTAALQFDPGWRRSYKAVWNEFFAQEPFAPPVSVTADSVADLLSVRRAEGRFMELAGDSVDPADNYTVVANTIELNEFARRQAVAKRNFNQQLIGNDYIDQLRRFGVKVNEALISVPQFLGSKSVAAEAVGVENNTGTGNRQGRWEMAVDFDFPPHFMQEHGYLWVMASFRVLDPLLLPPDMVFQANPSAFINMVDDLQRPVVEVGGVPLGTVGTGAWMRLDTPFVADASYRADLPTGVSSAANGSLAAMLYPAGQAGYTFTTMYRSRINVHGKTHALASIKTRQ